MSTINTSQSNSSSNEASAKTSSAPSIAPSGDQNAQTKQQDSMEKSEMKQEQRLSPDANNIYLQQPEVQQAIVSLMMSILASSGPSATSASKDNTSSAKNKNTSIGVEVSSGGGSSLSAEQQSFMVTHDEALKSVASDMVKKMLKQMPKGDVSIQIQMMMAKTQNDIISAMWNAFQRGVKENNERNETASKEHNIQHNEIIQENIKANIIKHGG